MKSSIVAAGLFFGASALFFACSSSSSTPAVVDAGKPAPTKKIGESCPNGPSDCIDGQCDTSDTGGGQCFKPCTASQDSECGDTTKYVCNYEGHCYPTCNATSDCARASEGYICKDDTPARNVKFCDAPH